MRRKVYIPIHLTAFASILLIGFAQRATNLNLGFLIYVVLLLMIPPSVKRLHDMGYSGWFYIGVIAIPYASFLLLFIPGDAGTEFGPDPRIAPPPVPNAGDIKSGPVG